MSSRTYDYLDYLDENAAAGKLSDLFAMDVTAAAGQCAHCGAKGRFAETLVYMRGLGLVARCAACTLFGGVECAGALGVTAAVLTQLGAIGLILINARSDPEEYLQMAHRVLREARHRRLSYEITLIVMNLVIAKLLGWAS